MVAVLSMVRFSLVKVPCQNARSIWMLALTSLENRGFDHVGGGRMWLAQSMPGVRDTDCAHQISGHLHIICEQD